MKRSHLAVVLVAAALFAVFLGARFGSVSLTTDEFVAVLSGGGREAHRALIFQIRLPRIFLGLLVGGGLALAGSVFQALLRNPLAEPFILGISGGAAAGAVLVIALGFVAIGSVVLPAAAFAGALLAILLVFGVAATADRRLDVRVLLLAGVVVGSFFTAVIALILSLSEARAVRSAILWMMGSLAGADWSNVAVVAAYTLPSALVLLGLARALNLMAVGEETAAYLGADVERVKRIAYIVASLMTAAGVAVAGVIGFVGLIVPHGVRLLIGPDQRALLPLSFLAGAAFLCIADLLARVLLAPFEIPIGVITAFLGVPLFLLLLRRSISG
ncbi:MAG: iron ABC transporter permease [Gemmatimonadales bacterium]|nr:MAG: iron ABC transporter permease [Gemmatimonadales bacterium]